MSDSDTAPIVVGVGAEGESDGALRFAVDEALRQNCGISIVHAVSASLAPPDPPRARAGSTEREAFFAGRTAFATAERLTAEAARRVHELGRGRVVVDTRLPATGKIHALVRASQAARLVVVQHRDLPTLERIFMRSVSVGLSARAYCPVVTVPPRWSPDLRLNRVTVGLDDLDDVTDVLTAAFEDAERRSVLLDVVHTVPLGGDVPGNGSRSTETERKTAASHELDEVLAPWRRQYPQVRVEQHTSELGAISVLLARSLESDLLVLGQRRGRVPFPLGAVARSMVNRANCPVKIVAHGVSSTPSTIAVRPTEARSAATGLRSRTVGSFDTAGADPNGRG